MAENPDVHEIEVGGQKFLVTDAMRQAIETERQAKKEEPRKNSPSFPHSAGSSPPSAGYTRGGDSSFFDDPDAHLTAKLEQAKSEWRSEWKREQQIEDWWGTFFGQYPALKGRRKLIQTIMSDHLDALEKIQDKSGQDAAMKELAGIVRKQLVVDMPESKSEEETPPIVEGGPMVGHPAQQASPVENEEKPVTLGSLLKKRRERRYEAGKAGN